MKVETYVKSIIFQDGSGKEMIIKQGITNLNIITNDKVLCIGIVKSLYDDSLILFNKGVTDCIYFKDIQDIKEV